MTDSTNYELIYYSEKWDQLVIISSCDLVKEAPYYDFAYFQDGMIRYTSKKVVDSLLNIYKLVYIGIV
jgi:hypothetical protein